MTASRGPGTGATALLSVALLLAAAAPLTDLPSTSLPLHLPAATANDSVVSNFSAAVGRLVTLVGAAGGGLLALVWTRVALSWFSNDLSKKVQAKDRARDALVGTLLFVAALSGLLFALAKWVVGG
ncbi:MAG: hypothetical protein L3K23_08525 [Thermoplasmata archaeon]|nr:hypothetical protein [Thermoplasmata archaeon]